MLIFESLPHGGIWPRVESASEGTGDRWGGEAHSASQRMLSLIALLQPNLRHTLKFWLVRKTQAVCAALKAGRVALHSSEGALGSGQQECQPPGARSHHSGGRRMGRKHGHVSLPNQDH